jgi:hypothetical protein
VLRATCLEGRPVGQVGHGRAVVQVEVRDERHVHGAQVDVVAVQVGQRGLAAQAGVDAAVEHDRLAPAPADQRRRGRGRGGDRVQAPWLEGSSAGGRQAAGRAAAGAHWYLRITQERPTSWPAPSGVISTMLDGSSAIGTSTVPRLAPREAIAARACPQATAAAAGQLGCVPAVGFVESGNLRAAVAAAGRLRCRTRAKEGARGDRDL